MENIEYRLEVRNLEDGIYAVFTVTTFPDGVIAAHQSITGSKRDAERAYESLFRAMTNAGILSKEANP